MEGCLPQRKTLRIPDYDYSQGNVYFLTLCVKDRQKLFWSRPSGSGCDCPLSNAGTIAEHCIRQIPLRYQVVGIDKYCIMPDHIHMLLSVDAAAVGRPMVAPTVSRVVQQFKGAVSKQLGRSVWQ